MSVSKGRHYRLVLRCAAAAGWDNDFLLFEELPSRQQQEFDNNNTSSR